MHWMVCSVCYLGCMVVNINALFAEWRITERDYFQILLLGVLSGKEPTSYLFWDIDAVTATFHVLVNTYFFDFRLAVLIGLRALVHLIYLVNFNNFLVFNFPFLLILNNTSLSLDKSPLVIFNVVLPYQLNAFKLPKMV